MKTQAGLSCPTAVATKLLEDLQQSLNDSVAKAQLIRSFGYYPKYAEALKAMWWAINNDLFSIETAIYEEEERTDEREASNLSHSCSHWRSY